jgi:hypothetical protein
MTVLIGARDSSRGREAAAKISADGHDARAVLLDDTDQQTIDAAARWIDGGVWPAGRVGEQRRHLH